MLGLMNRTLLLSSALWPWWAVGRLYTCMPTVGVTSMCPLAVTSRAEVRLLVRFVVTPVTRLVAVGVIMIRLVEWDNRTRFTLALCARLNSVRR